MLAKLRRGFTGIEILVLGALIVSLITGTIATSDTAKKFLFKPKASGTSQCMLVGEGNQKGCFCGTGGWQFHCFDPNAPLPDGASFDVCDTKCKNIDSNNADKPATLPETRTGCSGVQCLGGACDNGTTFEGADCDTVHTSCTQRAQDFCKSKGTTYQSQSATQATTPLDPSDKANVCETNNKSCSGITVGNQCAGDFDGTCKKTGTNSSGNATCYCDPYAKCTIDQLYWSGTNCTKCIDAGSSTTKYESFPTINTREECQGTSTSTTSPSNTENENSLSCGTDSRCSKECGANGYYSDDKGQLFCGYRCQENVFLGCSEGDTVIVTCNSQGNGETTAKCPTDKPRCDYAKKTCTTVVSYNSKETADSTSLNNTPKKEDSSCSGLNGRCVPFQKCSNGSPIKSSDCNSFGFLCCPISKEPGISSETNNKDTTGNQTTTGTSGYQPSTGSDTSNKTTTPPSQAPWPYGEKCDSTDLNFAERITGFWGKDKCARKCIDKKFVNINGSSYCYIPNTNSTTTTSGKDTGSPSYQPSTGLDSSNQNTGGSTTGTGTSGYQPSTGSDESNRKAVTPSVASQCNTLTNLGTCRVDNITGSTACIGNSGNIQYCCLKTQTIDYSKTPYACKNTTSTGSTYQPSTGTNPSNKDSTGNQTTTGTSGYQPSTGSDTSNKTTTPPSQAPWPYGEKCDPKDLTWPEKIFGLGKDKCAVKCLDGKTTGVINGSTYCYSPSSGSTGGGNTTGTGESFTPTGSSFTTNDKTDTKTSGYQPSTGLDAGNKTTTGTSGYQPSTGADSSNKTTTPLQQGYPYAPSQAPWPYGEKCDFQPLSVWESVTGGGKNKCAKKCPGSRTTGIINESIYCYDKSDGQSPTNNEIITYIKDQYLTCTIETACASLIESLKLQGVTPAELVNLQNERISRMAAQEQNINK